MTAKNCANGPKLVLKDFCEKSFVRNVLYSLHSIMCHENNFQSPIRTYPIIRLHEHWVIFHVLEWNCTVFAPYRVRPFEFAPTLCRVRPHTFRVRPHQVEFAPWLSDIQMSWFVTKALAECAKCHVSDDHFEFRQLRGTCLGTGLMESTKYSAWDLGLPEITVYTELVIKRTTRFI